MSNLYNSIQQLNRLRRNAEDLGVEIVHELGLTHLLKDGVQSGVPLPKSFASPSSVAGEPLPKLFPRPRKGHRRMMTPARAAVITRLRNERNSVTDIMAKTGFSRSSINRVLYPAKKK